MTESLLDNKAEIKLRLSEFTIMLFKKLRIGDISWKDFTALLTEEEISRFKDSLDKLFAWASNCAPHSPITLDMYTEEAPGEIRAALERISHTVHERVAIINQRLQAFKEIAPPLEDVQRYLRPEERQQFSGSLAGAVDAYMARDAAMEAVHPGFWMVHTSAATFSYWTRVIEERRNAYIRKRRAQQEYQERVDRMAATANKVREQLKACKKPLLSVLPALKGHQPEEWGELYLPENERIAAWAEAELRKLLPPELRSSISWELRREMLVIPQPVYENSGGIPCLTWYFDAEVLVEAELWLDAIPEQSSIKMPVKDESGGEKLGTLYLGPREWSVVGVLKTPLALLSMLLTDKEEAPGITVVERDAEITVYAISGIGEETVEIANDFREFIREVAGENGIGKGLKEAGFIDADTAVLIDAKKDLPLPSPVEVPGQADPSDAANEVRKTLMDMGYQAQMVDKALAAVSFSGGMTLQQKVAAAMEAIHS